MSTFIQIPVALASMRMAIKLPAHCPLVISHWTLSTATKVLSLTRRPSSLRICQLTGVGGSKVLGVLRSALLPLSIPQKAQSSPQMPHEQGVQAANPPAPRPPPLFLSLWPVFTTSRTQGKDSLQPSVAWKNAT